MRARQSADVTNPSNNVERGVCSRLPHTGTLRTGTALLTAGEGGRLACVRRREHGFLWIVPVSFHCAPTGHPPSITVINLSLESNCVLSPTSPSSKSLNIGIALGILHRPPQSTSTQLQQDFAIVAHS